MQGQLGLAVTKSHTKAKESGPKSSQEIGHCKRFQTSDWILSPGSKDSPRSTNGSEEVVMHSNGGEHTKEAAKRESTQKG